MTSEQVLSINELALSRRNRNSERADRGGGGQFSFAAEKLYESPPSENILKSPPSNPRLAKALEWCKNRQQSRECCHSHR